MDEVKKHIDQIRNICSANKVKSLFAFGSVVTNSLKSDSDIDFIVDIDEHDPIAYTNIYFNLKFNFEKIFNRKIDLLETRAVKNRFVKKQIDTTKQLIYGV
jgi:hypothetical protein